MSNLFQVTESTGWLHIYSLAIGMGVLVFLPSLVCLYRDVRGWLPISVLNACALGCLDGGFYARSELPPSMGNSVAWGGLMVLACAAWVAALVWALHIERRSPTQN